jgi:hypothetical protein
MKQVGGSVIRLFRVFFLTAIAITGWAASHERNAAAQNSKFPWSDTMLSPDQRAVAIGGASDDVPLKAKVRLGE